MAQAIVAANWFLPDILMLFTNGLEHSSTPHYSAIF